VRVCENRIDRSVSSVHVSPKIRRSRNASAPARSGRVLFLPCRMLSTHAGTTPSRKQGRGVTRSRRRAVAVRWLCRQGTSPPPPNWGRMRQKQEVRVPRNETETRSACSAGSSPTSGVPSQRGRRRRIERANHPHHHRPASQGGGIHDRQHAGHCSCQVLALAGPRMDRRRLGRRDGCDGDDTLERRRRGGRDETTRCGAALDRSRVVAAAVGDGIEREPGIGSPAPLLECGERPNRGDGPRPRRMDRNRSERQGPRTVVLFRRLWFLGKTRGTSSTKT
jgi:hypothetical protein